MKKSLAVVYGGAGREHEVSVMGFHNLARIIDRTKYRVLEIFIDKSGAWYFLHGEESYPTFPVRLGNKSGFLIAGRIVECDVVFPLLHGDMGEDGNIQGLLTSAGIPFVGEKTLTGALAADKSFAKIIAESNGVPTVRSITLDREPLESAVELIENTIGYPVFIKPVSLGSSVGASGAYDRDGLVRAYKNASALDRRILAEELVCPKRELECAVLRMRDKFIITPPSEIIIDGEYGYNEKYKASTRLSVRAEVSDAVKHSLHRYCELMIKAIGISSMSRIDFFLSGDKIYFNEINTMPGFTGGSLYLRMLEESGISESEAIDSIVECPSEGFL